LNAQKSDTVEFIDIPERMNSTSLDLTPNETKTIPVWGGINNTELVSGGVCHHKMPNSVQGESSHGSSRCCIGAWSRDVWGREIGGNNCHQTMTVYKRVRKLALNELDMYPIKGALYSQNNDLILKCDVCQIVRIAASLKHKRIAFVGDSIQTQAITGFECELSRRGFHLSEWRKITTPFSIEQPAPPNQKAWRYGLQFEDCVNVTVPSWILDHDVQQGLTLSSHVEICLYSHHRPIMNMEAHKMIAAKSDIMLINYGLHYKTGMEENVEFKSTLEALLLEFKTNIIDCTLIYRETSAQHFDSHDGEYGGPSTKCMPHKSNISLQPGWHWRRNILQEAAASQNFSVVDPYGMLYHYNTEQVSQMTMENKVILLPFHNFSSKLYDLHGNEQDCTHFCYTPHTWYPLWRHFRIAMDHIIFNANP